MTRTHSAVNWLVEKSTDEHFSGNIPTEMLKRIEQFVRSLPEQDRKIVNTLHDYMLNWREGNTWFCVDGHKTQKTKYDRDIKNIVFQFGAL